MIDMEKEKTSEYAIIFSTSFKKDCKSIRKIQKAKIEETIKILEKGGVENIPKKNETTQTYR